MKSKTTRRSPKLGQRKGIRTIFKNWERKQFTHGGLLTGHLDSVVFTHLLKEQNVRGRQWASQGSEFYSGGARMEKTPLSLVTTNLAWSQPT